MYLPHRILFIFLDPVTKKFLAGNIDPVFGFPQIVRFSWSTAEKILTDNGAEVEWFVFLFDFLNIF